MTIPARFSAPGADVRPLICPVCWMAVNTGPLGWDRQTRQVVALYHAWLHVRDVVQGRRWEEAGKLSDQLQVWVDEEMLVQKYEAHQRSLT